MLQGHSCWYSGAGIGSELLNKMTSYCDSLPIFNNRKKLQEQAKGFSQEATYTELQIINKYSQHGPGFSPSLPTPTKKLTVGKKESPRARERAGHQIVLWRLGERLRKSPLITLGTGEGTIFQFPSFFSVLCLLYLLPSWAASPAAMVALAVRCQMERLLQLV